MDISGRHDVEVGGKRDIAPQSARTGCSLWRCTLLIVELTPAPLEGEASLIPLYTVSREYPLRKNRAPRGWYRIESPNHARQWRGTGVMGDIARCNTDRGCNTQKPIRLSCFGIRSGNAVPPSYLTLYSGSIVPG